jgi:hypothetical protein
MHTLLKTGLSAVIAYTSHYSITKLYSNFCIPDGVYGFFKGILSAGSPVCSTTFSVMSNTHITYSTILMTSLSRLLIDGLETIMTKKSQ